MPILLDFDAAELEGFALKLELNRKDMEAAVRAAANRTARWARVQIARGLASRLGVSVSTLQGKRLTAKSSKVGAKVWIALNPLNAYKAGAKATGRGLRAGRTDFAGAFVMAGKHGGKAAVQRKGKARFPLQAASLDVLGVAPEELNSKTWPALNERFLEFYLEELGRRGSV